MPEKVLLDLGGKCVLKWVLDRLSCAKKLSQIVVATSDSERDNIIAELCEKWSVRYFRGSENDVLGRFSEVAKAYDADIIVRVNADNPFIDPDYIDKLIEYITSGESDYVSYQTSSGKPVMLTAISFFAEALTRNCLEKADKIIKNPFEREHVTLGIYKRPDVFKVEFLTVPEFCDKSDIRLTLDTLADFDVLQKIVSSLGKDAPKAKTRKIMELIESRRNLVNIMKAQNSLNYKKTGQ